MVRVTRAAPDALEQAEIKGAFKRGKPRKRVSAPRAVDHGYLKGSAPQARNGAAKKPVTKGHEAFKEANLAVIAAADPSVSVPAPEMYQAKVVEGAENGLDPVSRAQYAALETRKELAAIQLGLGATFEEAGDAAGVSAGTVKKYLENRDFRARVDELRAITRNKVAGRIEAYFDRVTADPDALDQRDPKVILGIYDRISGPVGRNAPVHNEQTNNNLIVGYSDLMGRLTGITRQSSSETSEPVADAGAQSGAFPLVGPDGDPVAG